MAERKWFKGPAALAVDDWFSSGAVPTNLAEARNYLQSGQSFAAIVQALSAADRGRPEFVHPLAGSALQGPQFETVTRQGYLEAIGLAFGHAPPVPIKTFWMTGAGNTQFEMHISDETDQVAVTLFVPDVEGGSERPGSPEGWVVSIGADGQAETKQTSGPPNARPPSVRGTAAV